MTRRFTKFLPMVMVLALALAACGGNIGASTAASAGGGSSPAAFPTGPVSIELWTKEGDPQIKYVQSLAADYTKLHSNVTFKVINKNVEALREQMVKSKLAPKTQPELLWTVADHLGPFQAAGVIQPLGSKVDASLYAPSAMAAMNVQGQVWGIPISNGNQLMLYYNKSIVATPPADTDAMITLAKQSPTRRPRSTAWSTTRPNPSGSSPGSAASAVPSSPPTRRPPT